MTEEIRCPVCGGEPDIMYIDQTGSVVGCEYCLKAKYYYEVGVEE